MSICEKKIVTHKIGLIISFCIGILFFLLIFGWEMVPLSNVEWIVNSGEEDLTTHYSAWTLYRNSEWKFPLGYCQELLWPSGKTITYADAIPIVAILAKMFKSILPNPMQYFGVWILFSFGLQALFSYKIISLFTDSVFLPVITSIFFLLCPVMINRAFDHCALASHWIILVSLYLYIKSMREKKLSRWFIFITTITIGIHPYFIPFTYFFIVAYMISMLFNKNNQHFFQGLRIAALSLGTTIFFGFIIGAFYGKSYSAVVDIGWRYGDLVNSTNLNTWINPHNAAGNWSLFLKEWPEISSQTGGFSYLGVGIIILLLLAIFMILSKKELAMKYIHQHMGLLVMSIIFTLYAIGPLVTFGDMMLLKIPLSEELKSLFSVFRAGGRFLWVVDYIVITVSICLCFQLLKKQRMAIFVLLGVLQLIDISPMLIKRYTFWKKAQEINFSVLKSDMWEYLGDNCKNLVGVQRYYGLPTLAAWGYRNNMKVSINSLARGITEEQENFNLKVDNLVREGKIEPDTIYFIEDKNLFYHLAYSDDNIFAAYVDNWFPIIVKKKENMPTFFDSSVIPYNKNNIRVIRGYVKEQTWVSGVLADENSIILPKTDYIREALKNSTSIKAGNKEANILEWNEVAVGIKVRLDITLEEIDDYNCRNTLSFR